MSDPRITNEVRKAARDAALHRWGTGSADATQMLLSVDAALEAALPHLAPQPVDRDALIVALHNEGAYCGDCDYDSGWRNCKDCQKVLGWYADAVLALINGSQANG